jgi:cytidylate kinase
VSALARESGEKLRRRFARLYGVDISEVIMVELVDDECEVKHATREDLPTWSTGRMGK